MPVYSYSRLSCFETCPRQYKFRYIEKAPSAGVGIERHLGTVVHETLEKCHRLAQAGRPPAIDELAEIYRAAWEREKPEEFLIVDTELTAGDYFSIGAKCVEAFHHQYYPFDQEMTLGLERQVHFSLDDEGKYRLTGIIDRISRDNAGRLKIQDYKTSGNLPTQSDVDKDDQLALYQIAVSEMWPDNNGIELVWHYLRFDKEMISHRGPEQLEALRRKYMARIDAVEKATALDAFPPQESNLCPWCEYESICPAKGGHGVEPDQAQMAIGQIPEETLTGLANEYIALSEGKKKISRRLEELERLLLGQVESGERVFRASGESYLMAYKYRRERLPTKTGDADTYEKISEAVKRTGCYNDYSILNLRGLQKAFDDSALREDLQEALKELTMVVIETGIKIKS